MEKRTRKMNGENKKSPKKGGAMSFRPDPDVREMLIEALSVHDDPHGLRSKLINDALREELPRVVSRWLERQQEVHDKIALRFAKHKKGQKGQ